MILVACAIVLGTIAAATLGFMLARDHWEDS